MKSCASISPLSIITFSPNLYLCHLVFDWRYPSHILNLPFSPFGRWGHPQLIVHFIVSLDLPQPKLANLTAATVLPPVDELSAKPPQTPAKDEPPSAQPQSQSRPQPQTPSQQIPKGLRDAMVDPEEDPWNTPDVHKGHHHARPNGADAHVVNGQQNGFGELPTPTIAGRTVSQYAVATATPASNGGRQGSDAVSGPGAWGYFDGTTPAVAGFNDSAPSNVSNPFVAVPGAATPGSNPPAGLPRSLAVTGRTGSSVEENVIVTLMPEKEGVFMFQHHNYEIASQRRGSKVIRRYSDFVWLLDCLLKRYPFRVLPLLPPKRMGVNGSHLSNDGAFIEKRRRGLARFLNALLRHPILSQEQLVVMFLTVPTVSLFHLPT